MSPLPGTRAIPAGWSAHHAPVAEGALNGAGTVYDPDLRTTGWDDATESPTVVEGAPLYDGPLGIMSTQSEQTAQQAGDVVRTREYLVRFAADCPWLREGLLVKVTNGHADVDLTGRTLTVIDAQLGTERFQRDVVCRDSTETPTA
ncbi:DUF6093 family protein [Knoellia sp. LjRoot47]|uniref:DUF6093 family protein n=1 Tax=Knoellia sp. LjRoot47 TaxID=3342330 RepID=UPI003ECE7F3A